MVTVAEKTTARYQGLKVSREEYLSLTDDGYRYDMVGGVLQMSPSAFYQHNRALHNFSYALEKYLQSHPLGESVPETDIFLPDGDDVLRPDLSFILHKNINIIKGYIHGTPDLLCEVLSDSTLRYISSRNKIEMKHSGQARERDLGVKADRYLANGVKEYWLINPDAQTIEVWYNEENNHWQKNINQPLNSKLLPGFTVDHSALWKG